MLLYTVARCFLSKRLKAAIKFFSSYFTNRWSWCKRGMVLLNEGKTCLLLNWKAYQFLHNFSAQQRVNTSSCFPFPNAFFSSEWNRFSMIKNNEIFILLLFPQHFLNSSIVVKSSKRMIYRKQHSLIIGYWIEQDPIFGFPSLFLVASSTIILVSPSWRISVIWQGKGGVRGQIWKRPRGGRRWRGERGNGPFDRTQKEFDCVRTMRSIPLERLLSGYAWNRETLPPLFSNSDGDK